MVAGTARGRGPRAVLPVDGGSDEETDPVRMRGLPPLDERRATALEYVVVALTIAVIVALAVLFLGGEIVADAVDVLR